MRRILHDGRVHPSSSDFLPRARVGEFVRASGDRVCAHCGKTYARHPSDPYELDRDGNKWLTVLCDGARVKL